MLIQFRVKNYKSFRDETTFDMSATSQREHSNFLIEENQNKILPVSVIYGANSNGKSNFIEAFFRMVYCVVLSFDIYKEKQLPVTPYIFSDKGDFGATSFEIIMDINEVEYKYGFILDKDRIYHEWLLYKPFNKTSKAQYKKLFERNENVINLFDKFVVYEELKYLVKEKNLFLSILGRRDEEIAKDIYNWFFRIEFQILDENNGDQYVFKNLSRDSKLFERVKKEIREIDPCIKDMKIYNEINKINNNEVYELKTIHKLPNSDKLSEYIFDIESEGTKKLFYLYYKIYVVLQYGGVLFIDELDSKIHALALYNIVKLFNDRDKNKKNAQIIFTCHNPFFLDNKFLRRDEIWFIDKNRDGISKLYSLSDFKNIRSDLDYYKAYLSGKFGSIPYMERDIDG